MRKAGAVATLLAGVLLSSAAWSASLDAPDPIHGVTFDEWAAGNARLSNNARLADILRTLEVDERQWTEINDRFTAALREGGPGNGLIDRYGEMFAAPAIGRFKGAGEPLEQKAKLATFEDYARLQSHLSVGVEAGVDPQAILEEHGLTTWEFSQESGNWVQEMAKAAGAGDQGESIRRLQNVLRRFENEYRARYGLKEKPLED